MNDFQIHHRANGDFDVEHLQRQPREERPQDAEKGVSGMGGCRKGTRALTEALCGSEGHKRYGGGLIWLIV